MTRQYSLLGFIIFLCVLGFQSHAQFAPIWSIWNHATLDPSNYPEQQAVRTTITKDTVIKSRVYSVFENTFGQRYFKSLDSGRVYFYALNDHHLFFDFNAKKGDTIIVDRRVSENDIVQQPIVVDTIFYRKDSKGDSVKAYSLGDRMVCEKFLVDRNGKYEGMATEDVLGFTYGSLQSFYCYREPSGFSFIKVDSLECDRVGNPEIHPEPKWVQTFPNPANQILTISSDHPNLLITLYDVMGKPLLSQSTTINTSQIDVSMLPAGCYWISVTDTQNRTFTKKIIIAR